MISNFEFAPGIPDKNIKASLPSFTNPQKWEFVLHDHKADKAGQHYDMRLGDPSTNQAHSWVVRSWPKPGEKVLAVMQPTHTVRYMDFSGVIEDGYGKGTVDIAERNQVEVTKSEPNKITFNKYNGGSIEKFALVRTNGDQWVLVNYTTSKQIGKFFSESPKFKMKDWSNKYTPKLGDVLLPKIDGAYATTILRPNKPPVVLSSRVSKKTGLPIEYTPKIYNLLGQISPSELGTTILRTEVFATKADNSELPNRTLGGILNANVWKSRELQKKFSAPLQLAATDVIRYRGRDVSKLPIQAKLDIIDNISKKFPIIQDPREVEKRTHFFEGKVVWRDNKPHKVKVKPDYDVYVKNIFADKNNKMAGGFEYSLTPDGPVVGRVGTGWKHNEKVDMLKNPQDYINRVAKVYAMEQHPSGALRAPSFYTWHLDK